MVKQRTVVRRIHCDLADYLTEFGKKNKTKFVESTKLTAEMLLAKKRKKRMIENIRREIEF